jgi:hypothetical protein
MAGFCVYSNEPSGPLRKRKQFIGQLTKSSFKKILSALEVVKTF